MMIGDMGDLAIAVAAFLLGHVGISSTSLRPWLKARLGHGTYLVLYSLQSAVLLVWVVLAWRAAPLVPLWQPAVFWRHLPYGGMAVACILLVGGLTGPNPSMAGRPGDAGWRPQGVFAVTRHPMMWAIGLWGLVHVGANGDLAALLLFGGLAALALGGSVLIDRRKAREEPAAWRAVRAQTSNLPLLALLQGRVRPAGSAAWLTAVAGGAGLFVLLVLVHPWIAGVAVSSPFP